MDGIEVTSPTFREGHKTETVDIKEAIVQIKPLTPELTPATTPDEQSPCRDDIMAGKKVFALERPDDRARALAARLTLEEQVRRIFTDSGPRSLGRLPIWVMCCRSCVALRGLFHTHCPRTRGVHCLIALSIQRKTRDCLRRFQ